MPAYLAFPRERNDAGENRQGGYDASGSRKSVQSYVGIAAVQLEHPHPVEVGDNNRGDAQAQDGLLGLGVGAALEPGADGLNQDYRLGKDG